VNAVYGFGRDEFSGTAEVDELNFSADGECESGGFQVSVYDIE